MFFSRLVAQGLLSSLIRIQLIMLAKEFLGGATKASWTSLRLHLDSQWSGLNRHNSLDVAMTLNDPV